MEGYLHTGLFFIDADLSKVTNSGVSISMDLDTECHQVDQLSIHRTIGVQGKLLLLSLDFPLAPESPEPGRNRILLGGDFI